MATLQDELIAKGLAKEIPEKERTVLKPIDSDGKVFNIAKQSEINIEKEDDNKLTPEQIKNWREVLCLSLGPYALIMPDELVQRWRDKLQQDVYSWNKKDN